MLLTNLAGARGVSNCGRRASKAVDLTIFLASPN